MYTLEDDQETSARLRKRAFQQARAAQMPDVQAAEAADPALAPTAPARPSRREQITSSFKQLAMPGTAVASRGERRLAIAALFVACASVFVTSMDETVVVTALPKIIADPGINISISQLDHAAWIVSAYLLGFVIAMPLMGRISDIFGRRRIMLLCLSIFGAGSVLCALAPALGQSVDISFLHNFGLDTSSQGLIWLIAARFIQAIGGGAVVPVAIAIVSDFYGKSRLSVALGIIGAVTEAGGVVGPLYGALLVQTLGWTSIFYLNIPIVAVLIVGVIFCTPKHQRRSESVDWLGALLLGVALTCLSLGLAQQGTELGPSTVNGSAPQNNPLALAVALVFFILFIVIGRLKSWRVPQFALKKQPHFSLVRRQRWPVVELSLFKRLSFSAASLVSLFVGAALIIAMADIPLFVDTVLSQQVSSADMAMVSGLALLRMTAMIPVGALLGGWLCGKLTCRLVGVLGLLFTAAGFYLMSRWPISVDWTQITISTLTTGLGFGLVIAPISTTAINAVRASQAGMGAAIITALRMVGMILGLAALTSWGLAYFKHLASQFPSLPLNSTATEFAQWSHNYALHLIDAAHTVYSSIFFITMILCLIAIVPAIFLWGTKPALEATLPPEVTPAASPADASDDLHNAVTVAVPLSAAATGASGSSPTLLPSPAQQPRTARRRLVFALVGIGLAMLLVAGGLTALLFWPSDSSPGSSVSASSTAGTGSTPASGPRMIQLALNNVALTSIFVSQLGLQGGTLSNIATTPTANDGLIITLDLNIDADGIHRVMPVELDTQLGLDNQQNIQLTVRHLKRDGQDAGSAAAASMQSALNQMMLKAVMPALRGQLQGAKLISVHTSTALACGKGQEMLVLLIQAPPIQGIAAQPTPSALCFTKPVDLNKLLPG
ncbi:MAG TPA: MFS transporter [Ktedonobacteraceae bacterium]|nr:MFS transporter [Ktedonobacteraceae bacterium]